MPFTGVRYQPQDLEAKLAKKRNEFTEAQDRLKTVGKEGYMRLAAEVETYKVSSNSRSKAVAGQLPPLYISPVKSKLTSSRIVTYLYLHHPQRRRGDGLNFVREEAAKEAVKEFVPVLDLLEELEAKYAGVTDETSLKVLTGYRNLQTTFMSKVEKLGLQSIIPGE